MDKPEDHGGGDVNSSFCKYCTDEKGNLLPREQVRAKMIQFYVQKQSKTQEEAEKLTDQLMGSMPAWKGEGTGVSTPVKPVEGPEPSISEKPAMETPASVSPAEKTAETPLAEPTISEPTVEETAIPGTEPDTSESTATPSAEEAAIPGAKPDSSEPTG